MDYIVGLFIYVVIRCVYGFAAYKIAENKNRSTSWFWGGFLLGWIGLLILLLLPSESSSYYSSVDSEDAIRRMRGEGINKREAPKGNEWKCKKCGEINPSYIGTCGCGCPKEDSLVTYKNVSAVKEENIVVNEFQKTNEYVPNNNPDVSSIESIILKIVERNPEGISAMGISKCIPRNISPAEAMEAIKRLESDYRIELREGLYFKLE